MDLRGLALIGVDTEDETISLILQPHPRDNCQAPLWWRLEFLPDHINSWRTCCDEEPHIPGSAKVCPTTLEIIGEQLTHSIVAAFEEKVGPGSILYLVWSNGRALTMCRHEDTILIFDDELSSVIERACEAHTVAVMSEFVTR
ncbi:MAG: hypothetical protein ACNA8W_25115 [Bradymonadaceae bacterium]